MSKPRLVTGLMGRTYVVTRYTEQADGVIVAHTKHDVTDDFFHVLERLGWIDALIAAGHIDRMESDEEGA